MQQSHYELRITNYEWRDEVITNYEWRDEGGTDKEIKIGEKRMRGRRSMGVSKFNNS